MDSVALSLLWSNPLLLVLSLFSFTQIVQTVQDPISKLLALPCVFMNLGHDCYGWKDWDIEDNWDLYQLYSFILKDDSLAFFTG